MYTTHRFASTESAERTATTVAGQPDTGDAPVPQLAQAPATIQLPFAEPAAAPAEAGRLTTTMTLLLAAG